jgi:hypothetical protein
MKTALMLKLLKKIFFSLFYRFTLNLNKVHRNDEYSFNNFVSKLTVRQFVTWLGIGTLFELDDWDFKTLKINMTTGKIMFQ